MYKYLIILFLILNFEYSYASEECGFENKSYLPMTYIAMSLLASDGFQELNSIVYWDEAAAIESDDEDEGELNFLYFNSVVDHQRQLKQLFSSFNRAPAAYVLAVPSQNENYKGFPITLYVNAPLLSEDAITLYFELDSDGQPIISKFICEN